MSKDERNEIAVLLRKNYSMRDVAGALARAVSNISREIAVNSVNGKYDPLKAQHKAYVRRHQASYRGKKIVSNQKLRSFVEKHLLDGQSPEAISGRLECQQEYLPYVSKDTIYRYLRSPYGKIIGLFLKKKKRPRRRSKTKKLRNRTFIDKRPKIIEKRGRVGDMEADFIVSGKSGKGVLLVAVCRKTRATFLELIHDVSIDNVHGAFKKIKGRLSETKTLTLDNDLLFNMHKTLEKLLKVKIYFCHPYHSWEKGSVENTNKEIRKYIPKGSNLANYDQEFITLIEKRLNGRFMKCLKYATPREVLNRSRKQKQRLRSRVSKKPGRVKCST